MGKNLKTFILHLGKGKGHLFSPLTHKIVLEFLERSVNKKSKDDIHREARFKLSPFSDTVILYLEDLKK